LKTTFNVSTELNKWKYIFPDKSRGDSSVVLAFTAYLLVSLLLYVFWKPLALVFAILLACFLLFLLAKKLWANHTYRRDYVKPSQKHVKEVTVTELSDRTYYK